MFRYCVRVRSLLSSRTLLGSGTLTTRVVLTSVSQEESTVSSLFANYYTDIIHGIHRRNFHAGMTKYGILQSRGIESAIERNEEALELQIARAESKLALAPEEGEVVEIRQPVALVSGLQSARVGCLAEFESLNGEKVMGLIVNLERDIAAIALLDQSNKIKVIEQSENHRSQAGSKVYSYGEKLSVPVTGLEGRVVNALGQPLDDKEPLKNVTHTYALKPSSIPLTGKARVTKQLRTGIKSLDAFHPLGLGARFVILGERNTGKTSMALDIICNQVPLQGTFPTPEQLHCIYVCIGKTKRQLETTVKRLEEAGALPFCTVVASTSDMPRSLHYLAPTTAMAIAERKANGGGNALVVLDDLTEHAAAYEYMAKNLKRPSAVSAAVSEHGPLLERAGARSPAQGGGSITVLSIGELEPQAETVTGFHETEISIHDDHLIMDASLARQRIYPAINVITPAAASRNSALVAKSLAPYEKAVRSFILNSYETAINAERAREFGFEPDEEIEDVIEQRKMVQVLFEQGLLDCFPHRTTREDLLAVFNKLMDYLRVAHANLLAHFDASPESPLDDRSKFELKGAVEDFFDEIEGQNQTI